jgi:hypothetical protein
MTREEAALASLLLHGLLVDGVSFAFDVQEDADYSIVYPTLAGALEEFDAETIAVLDAFFAECWSASATRH